MRHLLYFFIFKECDFCSPLQAKSIYSTMFPGEEFLARVPDPEDVILGDPDEEEERGQQQQLDQ